MADQAKLTVRVTATRAGSVVQFSTVGRYKGLVTGGISQDMTMQPVQTTASAKAFWESVLALVQAKIATL